MFIFLIFQTLLCAQTKTVVLRTVFIQACVNQAIQARK